MATSWYKNYLAADVQPWARQVQKEVDNLKSNFQSAEVNNTTRDDQLASSLRQVQSAANDATQASADATQAAADAADAAQDALDAINGLTGLGSPGSSYEVDGTNIVVNTITANEINSGYVYTNTLSANQITAGSLSADFISGGTIDATNVNVTNLNASNLNSGTITAVDISGVNIAGVSITASDFTSGGVVDVSEVNTGICTVSQDLRALTNTYVANNTTTSFNGNLFINSSGIMFRNPTISSQEAKENIEPIDIDSEAFISINPVTFNYKREAVRTDEEAEASNLGFILEDFEAAGFGEFLTIPTNDIDQYRGLRYDKLYMFLHKVVQEQHEKIQQLEARLEALEG